MYFSVKLHTLAVTITLLGKGYIITAKQTHSCRADAEYINLLREVVNHSHSY